MADVVKTPLDVSFQNPNRGFAFVQIGEALFNGVMRSSANTEPIGVRVSGGFGNRLQGIAVERLHCAVFHGGDAQGTLFPVFLGNIHPPERLRLIDASF